MVHGPGENPIALDQAWRGVGGKNPAFAMLE